LCDNCPDTRLQENAGTVWPDYEEIS